MKEDLVFPAASERMLSDMALSDLILRRHLSADGHFVDQRSKRPAVAHGLRSTFSNWVTEHGKSREAAGLQLAHEFGSSVAYTYYRADLIEERARLTVQ